MVEEVSEVVEEEQYTSASRTKSLSTRSGLETNIRSKFLAITRQETTHKMIQSVKDISIVDRSTSAIECVSITWLPRRNKQNTPILWEESKQEEKTLHRQPPHSSQ